MGVGAYLKFHFHQLRRFQPVLLGALVTSLALVVFALGSYFVNTSRLAAEQEALARQAVHLDIPANASAAVKPLALPSFDSVVLLSAIEQACVSTKVSTDAITFALEDGAGQPYRRYRASFTMLGRYPQIRAAIAKVLREVPFSSLESIKCMRDDIAEADVSCSVNMSAFYKLAQFR